MGPSSFGSVSSNQTSLLQTSRTAKLFVTKLEEFLAKVQQGKGVSQGDIGLLKNEASSLEMQARKVHSNEQVLYDALTSLYAKLEHKPKQPVSDADLKEINKLLRDFATMRTN